MEIKFKSTNASGNFINWLKGFKEIQNSLLIEVDLMTKTFVAKAFPQSKCIVKYSSISFEDAGYELLYINDNDNNAIEDWSEYANAFPSGARVKVGIYTILPKLIDVLSMFVDVENTMTIAFDVCEDVKYIDSKVSEKEYQAQNIQLKSLSLIMNIHCSIISEYFAKCEDDTFFNRVCKISKATTYSVTADTINNLLKIASVFSMDKARDLIKFYTKEENGKWGIYAIDESNHTYDYLMGYYDGGDECEAETSFYKDNFTNALKGVTGDVKMTLDVDGSSRMLVDSEGTKIVIAAAKYS